MVVIAQCLGLRVSEIMGLQWGDVDFSASTLLVQRSVVHGKVDDVKTQYSQDLMPLDPSLAGMLLEWKQQRPVLGLVDWVFANPVTGRPYHQEEIQKRYLKPAGTKAGLPFSLGSHTFRHTYRAWLDDTGAPMSVQQQLMRHASIQTTMNLYGQAMPDTKRQGTRSAAGCCRSQKSLVPPRLGKEHPPHFRSAEAVAWNGSAHHRNAAVCLKPVLYFVCPACLNFRMCRPLWCKGHEACSG